jgi:CheY-like chemotaxis protein
VQEKEPELRGKGTLRPKAKAVFSVASRPESVLYELLPPITLATRCKHIPDLPGVCPWRNGSKRESLCGCKLTPLAAFDYALLLVLEDDPADLRLAADTARRAGFPELEVIRTASEAKAYLEKATNRNVPLPDAMLIDLALGYESGFELLRYWHSRPRLREIPVIVWTIARDTQLEICRYFGVRQIVSKDDDPNVLREALSGIIQDSDGPPAS